MARVLIVGCGCRGRSLAATLVAQEHAVRGTTRDPESIWQIEATGAEGAVADPDRLGTVLRQLEGISVVCWLLATAAAAPLHGERLGSMLERLVDTPVRGFVYEGGGDPPDDALARGAALVRRAGGTFQMPVEVVEADPAGHDAWLMAMSAAVGRILSPD